MKKMKKCAQKMAIQVLFLRSFTMHAHVAHACLNNMSIVQCMFVGRDENMIFKKCGGEPGTNMHSGIRQLCQ